MRITVTIPDEVAAQVQAQGLTLESYVEKLMADAASASLDHSTKDSYEEEMQTLSRTMDARSRKHSQLPGAITKDRFYEDDAAGGPGNRASAAGPSLEEFRASLDALTRFSEKIPPLPIEVLSRESFYQDHD